MSLAKAELIRRSGQDAGPEYHLGRDLLDSVLAALPPPSAGAPVTWRHARLRRIINEIAAFRPFNGCRRCSPGMSSFSVTRRRNWCASRSPTKCRGSLRAGCAATRPR